MKLEEFQINMPKSLIGHSQYFQTLLFLHSSTSFGYINFDDEVKTKEFISIAIPINNYLVTQPILLKDYETFNSGMNSSENKTHSKKTKNNYSLTNEHKDPFQNMFLNEDLTKAKSSNSSNEASKHLKSKSDVFFLAISTGKVDIYSKTNLVKSFALTIPNFKTIKNKAVMFEEDTLDLKEKQETLDKEIEEAQELISEMNQFEKVKNDPRYQECLFQKNGFYSTYHESLPKYMFFLVYNCLDIFLNQRYQDILKKKDDEDHMFLKDIKASITIMRQNLYNQIKIVPLEIFSNQFISVDSLTNIENNLENYGKIRLFKNFREYLVIVYRSQMSKESAATIRVVVKKFDKYSGFHNVLNKKLFFNECQAPFYDILYKYKKNYKNKKFSDNQINPELKDEVVFSSGEWLFCL